LFFNLLGFSSFDLVFKVQMVFLLALIIKTINIVGISLLQRNENYISINLSLVIASCVFFCIIFISKSENFLLLCSIGFLARNILEFILISIKVLNFSQLLKVRLDFKSFKKLLADCRIFIFGQLFYKTEDLLDKYISSFLVEGFLSFTSFIKSIFSAFSNVLINSYIIQSLSYFSKNINSLKKSLGYLKKRIYVLFLISLIIIAGNAFLGNYVFTLLFENKFSPELTKYISVTLLVSSIVVFFVPLNAIYQNLLLSLALHKKIVFLDSLSYAISVILKIVLSIKFGIYGFLTAFVISFLIKNFIKSIAIIKLKTNLNE
jgi:O-antigen/teichoic acid export membrane protein